MTQVETEISWTNIYDTHNNHGRYTLHKVETEISYKYNERYEFTWTYNDTHNRYGRYTW